MPPDGYTEAESIVFKLVQEGNEQSNIVYAKSDDDWVKLNDATVIIAGRAGAGYRQDRHCGQSGCQRLRYLSGNAGGEVIGAMS